MQLQLYVWFQLWILHTYIFFIRVYSHLQCSISHKLYFPYSTWPGYLTCSGICIDICDFKMWLVFFHIRAIMFLLCCVTWFSDMWCCLHLMFVISKYGFFFHMRPVMFLLYCVTLVVFWHVLSFALGVCDFKMWLTFVDLRPCICCFAGNESVYDVAGLVTVVI